MTFTVSSDKESTMRTIAREDKIKADHERRRRNFERAMKHSPYAPAFPAVTL